jgi:transposase-like protein
MAMARPKDPTTSELQTTIKRIWRQSFQSELDSALEQHMRAQALQGVQAALETALLEELFVQRSAAIQALGNPVPLPNHLYLSGSYSRHVHTLYGTITDLRVPKLRAENGTREWHILTRYQQLMPHVLDRLCYLYTLGLSLRDLQEGVYLLLGSLLSRQAVNRVTTAAQTPMDAWRKQSLADTPPILIVDGVWVTIQYPTNETWRDKSGHERQRVRAQERVILAVLGVWQDGRHALLHYTIATAEDTQAWLRVFEEVRARELDAAAVKLVVSDGTKGLPTAMKTHLPTAKLQRCTVHKVRGMARYLSYAEPKTKSEKLASETSELTGVEVTPEEQRQQRRSAISRDALAIFEAASKAQAEQRLASFVARWAELEPKAIQTFHKSIASCFSFYECDASLHPLIRSTNLLERFFREFRAKADEIGAFPNEDSCLTIFHLVMVREHAKHDRPNIAKTS